MPVYVQYTLNTLEFDLGSLLSYQKKGMRDNDLGH